ncbi:cytochrome P450 [Streptomyces sp. 6N223]|uniref:cytochrome P450 n=1 Tax=Streptomyces sp. 6N223 TaxID=3457412 RepID=UPI003FCEEED7
MRIPDITTARPTALPPGPRLPFVVQALRMMYTPEAFTRACRQRYGGTYTLRVPQQPATVWSSDPALARLLTRLPPAVSTASEWNASAEFIWGPWSPLIIEGEEHRRARRLVVPDLRGPRMLAYQDEIIDTTQRAVAGWSRATPIRLLERMRELLLDLVVRTVFGSTADPLARQVAEHTENLRKVTLTPLLLPWTRNVPGSPYGRALRTRRELADCLETAFRVRSRQGGGPGLLGDLTRACAEQRLAEAAVTDQVIAYLMAGYATTATALTSTFDLLLQHPDALSRAESEATSGADSGGHGAWLTAVVEESLRLNPPVWVFGRVLRQSVDFGEWRLPAGVWVAFDMREMHRRVDSYPAPGDFRPERHLARAVDGGPCPSTVASWYVFGGGRRVCPAASFAPFVMRVVLGAVLAQVRLHPRRDRPGALTREATLLVVKDGVPVTVSDR